jgi:hypothetical protein
MLRTKFGHTSKYKTDVMKYGGIWPNITTNPLDQTQDRTRAAAVGSEQLTT